MTKSLLALWRSDFEFPLILLPRVFDNLHGNGVYANSSFVVAREYIATALITGEGIVEELLLRESELMAPGVRTDKELGLKALRCAY